MSFSSIAPSFSTVLSSRLDRLASCISEAPSIGNNIASDSRYYGYLRTLREIYVLANDLFLTISHCAKMAGFSDVQRFHASPRGRSESFVLCVMNDQARLVEVVLLKNSNGVLLNGEGDVLWGDTQKIAIDRTANEKFEFKPFDLHGLTVEFENGQLVSHSARGVNLFRIKPENAAEIAIANGVTDCELVRLPVEEFLAMTDNDTDPTGHGYDRKHVAKFIRWMNALGLQDDNPKETIARTVQDIFEFNQQDYLKITDKKATEVAPENGLTGCELAPLPMTEYIRCMVTGDSCPYDYDSRYVTDADCLVALTAKTWMSTIRVPEEKIFQLEHLITEFNTRELDLPIEGAAVGPWRSLENRGQVRDAAQRVVDAVVAKLLPPWIYEGSNGPLEACQVKVQEAIPVLVDGFFMPSFLNERQFFALQMVTVNSACWLGKFRVCDQSIHDEAFSEIKFAGNSVSCGASTLDS